jgi:monofunctional biosynthetic peptidoglycan transglycosylase
MGRRRSLRSRLAVAAALAVAGWLAWEAARWPDVASLARADPETTAFIERYRAELRRRGEKPAVAWTPVPYRAISPHLKRAVLVAEDIDFFDHDGFATEEMRQALRDAWRHRKPPRGASTLTQQLAKNLWLSPLRSPLRKAREALLTHQLERHLDKRRIFELYLNVVEFGPGVYGAEAASRRYFGRSAAALGEAEAAQLAASLPFPRTHPPGSAGRVYRERVSSIRRRMDRAQWLRRVI